MEAGDEIEPASADLRPRHLHLPTERRRYRFRLLNGCQSRFLILDFENIAGVRVWQIGNEGGFLASAVNILRTIRTVY